MALRDSTNVEASKTVRIVGEDWQCIRIVATFDRFWTREVPSGVAKAPCRCFDLLAWLVGDHVPERFHLSTAKVSCPCILKGAVVASGDTPRVCTVAEEPEQTAHVTTRQLDHMILSELSLTHYAIYHRCMLH